MSGHSNSHGKRNTLPRTNTPQGSRDSLWFDALEILDENGSEYLVRWAGKDLASGEEWLPSWTLKINCSLAVVKSWNDIQKKKNSDKRISTPIILNERTTTSQPAQVRRASARLSATRQASANIDTEQSLRHLSRRSTRTIASGKRTTNQKSHPIQSAVTTNSRKRKTFPSPEASLDSLTNSQHMRQPSSQGNWFEAIEILAQKGDEFEVSWAGIDPLTGKQWEPTWVRRKDCTPALLRAWKLKRGGGKKESGPISIQNELPKLRSATREPPIKFHIKKSDLQLFQQVPMETTLSIDKSARMILPRTISSKRKSIFDNAIPAKRGSWTDKSRYADPKYVAEGNPSHSTTEISSPLNRIPIRHKVIQDNQSEPSTSAIPQSQFPNNGTSLLLSHGSARRTVQSRWRRFAKSKNTQG